MDDDGGRGLRRGWRGERFALWCTPTWLVMTYFCSLTNLATKCWKSLIFYNFASEASKIELIQIKSIFFLCWISEIGCISRTDTEFEKNGKNSLLISFKTKYGTCRDLTLFFICTVRNWLSSKMHRANDYSAQLLHALLCHQNCENASFNSFLGRKKFF